jgi:hypothetical protein
MLTTLSSQQSSAKFQSRFRNNSANTLAFSNDSTKQYQLRDDNFSQSVSARMLANPEDTHDIFRISCNIHRKLNSADLQTFRINFF